VNPRIGFNTTIAVANDTSPSEKISNRAITMTQNGLTAQRWAAGRQFGHFTPAGMNTVG
jgi:hypothetical protein